MNTPTREEFETWSEEDQINWIAEKTKESGKGPEYGEPGWLFFKNANWSIRFTWKINIEEEGACLRDVRVMDYETGKKTWILYLARMFSIEKNRN